MSATAHAPSLEPASPEFRVHLEVFEGPFDLLLSLIAKHQLDVTEVALAQVTDEFLAYTRSAGAVWDLGQTTEFLVVAATLLDLKAARLLPAAEVEDEADLALLEARDLLFARLLQYRAYKHVAALFAQLLQTESQRYPRAVSLEPRFAAALPEVRLGLSPEQFASLAARALTPRTPPAIETGHIHVSPVDIAAHAALLRDRLQTRGTGSFGELTSDCATTMEIVARFLALLDLYRDGDVTFQQGVPLGELRVQWTAPAAVVR